MNFNLTQATEILQRSPESLRALLSNISAVWVETQDDPSNWSPYDVIGHLIYCEDADWIPRAQIIIDGDPSKVFEPFDRFAQFKLYRTQPIEELLDIFSEKRCDNLRILNEWSLTEEMLRRKAKHPELGEVTLENLLSTWVVHDLSHIRQITIYMARKYETTVGPWKEYLSILK